MRILRALIGTAALFMIIRMFLGLMPPADRLKRRDVVACRGAAGLPPGARAHQAAVSPDAGSGVLRRLFGCLLLSGAMVMSAAAQNAPGVTDREIKIG